jgi:hypothetical protein
MHSKSKSYKAKKHTARAQHKADKRRATKAQHRHTETPRGDRQRQRAAPINMWAHKLSSMFDVKPKERAA